MRSDSVDLPWSMWAMIEKLRMRARSMADVHATGAGTGPTGSLASVDRAQPRSLSRPRPARRPELKDDAMANIKSQNKRNRTNAKRAERNKAVR